MPQLRTNDGVTLFYRDWGTGRPVVFLHSMLMSSATWQYQLLHLVDRGCRVVAYDRRGHGRSDDAGHGYDFDRLADDLAEVLDGLDLADVTLVGHSMAGGEIVRYLTRHGADRVSRIVVVGSTLPHLEVSRADAAVLLERIRTDYAGWVADAAPSSFGEHPGHRPIPPLDKEQAIREWMSVSRQAALHCTENNLAADFRGELREITVPVLVVHGDHDAFAPLESCGLRTAELVEGSRLIVYEGAPHMIHLTHRAELNADLLAFVDGAAPRPG